MTSKGNILIVDDTPANIQLLAEMLTANDYDVRPTNSAKRAMDAILRAAPDLILLDVNMPDVDGYTFCQQLKANATLRDIPVLFISVFDELSNKVRGFAVGGVDYITKPFQSQEVLVRIETHLELTRRRQEIETLRHWETTYLRQMNELKDDLLNMASLDLKYPLGLVLGYSQFLFDNLNERQVLLPAEVGYFESIVRAAEQMRRLIHDLLELSLIEGRLDMQRTTVSLHAYLQKCFDDMTLAAEQKKVSLSFVSPEPDTLIAIAPERFAQVMQNVLSNAIKYTPAGGHVRLSAEINADQVAIQVADTGLGIPAEAIPHLFDRFYRVNLPEHQLQTGTGLGLTIVKSIVEQHDGQIKVESTLNKGTTITIVIPIG